jgi:hypothetical protein
MAGGQGFGDSGFGKFQKTAFRSSAKFSFTQFFPQGEEFLNAFRVPASMTDKAESV